MSIEFVLFLVVIFANLSLGAIALLRNPQSHTNRVFAGMTVIISMWMAGSYFEDSVTSINVAKLLLIIDLSFAPLMAFMLYEFITSFFGKNTFGKNFKIALLIGSIVAALMPLSPLLGVNSIQLTSEGLHYTETNWSYAYYLLVLAPLLASIATVLKFGKTLRGQAKTQVRIALLGLSLWAFIALLSNAVLPTVFGPTLWTRVGIYGASIYIALTSYAIIRHKLFDIRAVIARSVAYIFLLVTLSIAYGLLAFGVGQLFFESSKISNLQQVFNVIIAILLAFTFQPLRRFFEKITDKIFYRDKYDAQKLINDIGKILASYILLDKLAVHVLATIKNQMRVLSTDIIVVDSEKVYFEAQRYFVGFHDSLLHNLNKFKNQITVFDQLEEGELKEIMRQYGMSIIVSLRTNGQTIGYLLLSEKLNGDIYNDGDINVLQIIGDELAVAIENAKSYTKIQRFNVTLQEKVKEATTDLRDANEHLREVDKAKDDFISMASHQLKTPVTAINGYAEMLSQGRFGNISDKQKEAISKLLDRSNDVMAQVTDLLSVSRIDSGKFHFDPKPTDLNELVAKQVEQLQVRAKMNSTELIYTPAPTPVPILMLDTEKTRQAILNLIDNAIFYAAKGHVKVSLSADATDIIYKVVDDGIGVPEEVKPKLFGKYVRADNAKDERPDGTGLGLYLVKKVIEEQGGEIIFESQVGKGSTFGFKLPLSLAIQASQPPASSEPGLRPLPVAHQTFEQSRDLEQQLTEHKHATT